MVLQFAVQAGGRAGFSGFSVLVRGRGWVLLSGVTGTGFGDSPSSAAVTDRVRLVPRARNSFMGVARGYMLGEAPARKR